MEAHANLEWNVWSCLKCCLEYFEKGKKKMYTFLKSNKFCQSFVKRWQCYPLDHISQDNRIRADNSLTKEKHNGKLPQNSVGYFIRYYN